MLSDLVGLILAAPALRRRLAGRGSARLLVLQAPRSDRRNAAQHVPREVGVLGPRLP